MPALTFTDALNHLYGRAFRPIHRAHLGRRPTGNTSLERRGLDAVAVRLYGTDVVTIHRDGTYTLRTGGYHTVTTKQRLNAYGPCRVYERRGVWYCRPNGTPQGQPSHWEEFPFVDGMRVDATGRPLPS